MTSNLIDLSIVLPCYNEKENISSLIYAYKISMGERNNIEAIFVDNGSTDGTDQEIKRILSEINDPRLKTIKVQINRGYGFGILSGLGAATGRYLAWSHADQQCSPDDVFRLYDFLIASRHPERTFGKGYRTNNRGRAVFLTLAQELLSRIILGENLVEINAQPKVFPRELYKDFKMAPNGYELDIYAYYKAVTLKYEILSTEVIFHDRKHGQSKWSFSLTSKIKQILRNFSYLVFLRLNRKNL